MSLIDGLLDEAANDFLVRIIRPDSEVLVLMAEIHTDTEPVHAANHATGVTVAGCIVQEIDVARAERPRFTIIRRDLNLARKCDAEPVLGVGCQDPSQSAPMCSNVAVLVASGGPDSIPGLPGTTSAALRGTSTSSK